MDLDRLHPDTRVANCANCGRLCIARDNKAPLPDDAKELPKIKGTIHGRSWCGHCLNQSITQAAPASKEDGGGPWSENAVRALEDR